MSAFIWEEESLFIFPPGRKRQSSATFDLLIIALGLFKLGE
jgi:hypothetical protein